LVIAASGNLDLSGNSVISTDSAGRGAAGSINLSARDITIGGGSAVLSRSLCFSATDCGQSDAGDIVISSANLRLSERAAISTTARIADGGNIVLQIGGSLEIVDGRITTSVKGGLGNGGNISIFPRHLLLLRSRISADAVQGRGGNVTIVADEFIPSADSAVTASSSLGISGSIEVVAPRVDLNGSLVALSSELRSAAEVLRHSCAQRNLLPRSSLAATGRGGLPQDPEVSVPAVYLADRDADPMPAARGQAPQPRTQVVSLGITMHCD
jgi:hypothetical protein